MSLHSATQNDIIKGLRGRLRVQEDTIGLLTDKLTDAFDTGEDRGWEAGYLQAFYEREERIRLLEFLLARALDINKDEIEDARRAGFDDGWAQGRAEAYGHGMVH